MATQYTIKVHYPEDVSLQFLQGMADRMAMSRHKYGSVAEAKGRFDYVEAIKQRLRRYTHGEPRANIPAGNTEWLMDVANEAMIEFMHYPEAFTPTDASASPGMPTLDHDQIHDWRDIQP